MREHKHDDVKLTLVFIAYAITRVGHPIPMQVLLKVICR